jgi:hypothetical protein
VAFVPFGGDINFGGLKLKMIQGRSLKSRSPESLLESFPIDSIACEVTPNPDIRPGGEIYAIIRCKGENWLHQFHWGLIRLLKDEKISDFVGDPISPAGKPQQLNFAWAEKK